ncbi:ABZJ_00895 family protein [Psychrobacter frigidicola]|uniref:ABZJ_00895 family protein n=1 Tax=Psychrobacter frigidicola TaxID=45611 RepID=UPI001919B278|nr:ABZJ_00895 family protein [Psychrobacter frigidicola]
MPRTIPNLSKRNTSSKNSKPIVAVKMTQYVGFFVVGYVLATAIFMMIQTKLTVNSQLVTVLSILIGAYIAVHKFIKHQRRGLDRSEMNRLTIGGVAVVWLLTAIYFIGIWFLLFDTIDREVLLEMTTQQPLPLLSALVMILVLTLISARLGIWGFNRLLAPK